MYSRTAEVARTRISRDQLLPRSLPFPTSPTRPRIPRYVRTASKPRDATTPSARLTGTRSNICSLCSPPSLFCQLLTSSTSFPPLFMQACWRRSFQASLPSPMAGCRASCEAVVGPAIGCAHLFFPRWMRRNEGKGNLWPA